MLFHTLSKTIWQICFKQWKTHWNMCIKSQGPLLKKIKFILCSFVSWQTQLKSQYFLNLSFIVLWLISHFTTCRGAWKISITDNKVKLYRSFKIKLLIRVLYHILSKTLEFITYSLLFCNLPQLLKRFFLYNLKSNLLKSSQPMTY